MRAMRVSADVSAPLFSLRGLAVAYRSRQVVGGVDLDVARDEVVGLVGESGSGKTQTMLAALGLTGKSAEVRGSAKLDGFELIGARESALNALRGAKATMIFQEPMSALDPLSSIGSQIAAPMIPHKRAYHADAHRRAADLLGHVGLACGSGPRRVSVRISHRGMTVDYGGGGLVLRARARRALDAFDLEARKGRALGVVGESGSGKSALARALLRLVPSDGGIQFEGRNIHAMDQ